MLRISENGRFLQHEDGQPFFYLGDTAWELFHRLNREEAAFYLRDRASKGFNVVQAAALAEFDGLTEPNCDGELPMVDLDPARPNEVYFQHVDWVIDEAARLGISTALLPTWGDKFNRKWGVGPEIFTPGNAFAYGAWLGKRYRDRPIIWVLGGDRNPETPAHRDIIEAMAQGLKQGDGGRHLMTFHPQGRHTSGEFFHEAQWLDFNMMQSGHATKEFDVGGLLKRDYERIPVKPCLDGEPCYENHPVRQKPEQGWFDEYDVRKAAYRALFAGACGHAYGCHDIWQFYEAGREPITQARTFWREALNLPGAAQMRWARALLESRPFFERVPGFAGTIESAHAATSDADGSYSLIYLPRGEGVSIEGGISGREMNAHWFDPRNGEATLIGRFATRQNDFEPPSSGDNHDWVLVLDDAARAFPTPGQTTQNT